MSYWFPLLTLLSVALCLGDVSAMTVQVLKDQRGPGIVDRGVVIPVFTRDEVKRIAEEFLRDEAKGASIARLIIATDSQHLLENYSHDSPNVSYQEAAAEIERNGIPKGPMARVLSVHGRAKISYMEEGRLTEENLDSGDPTVFREGGYSYELLHFNITQSHLQGDPWFLTVYLKASPGVSIASCARIYEMLRHLTGLADLTIAVRPDPWFLDTYRYPAVLAFTRPLDLPNSIAFMSAAAVSCNLVSNQITCTGRNFVP